MALKFSTKLKTGLLRDDNLLYILNNLGTYTVLEVYSAPTTVPTSVENAVAADCAKLLRFTKDNSGTTRLSFEMTTTEGDTIRKVSTHVWGATGLASGTAAFWRFGSGSGDNLAAANTYNLPRIQGTIGTTGTDLIIASTSIVLGTNYTIDTFTIGIA